MNFTCSLKWYNPLYSPLAICTMKSQALSSPPGGRPVNALALPPHSTVSQADRKHAAERSVFGHVCYRPGTVAATGDPCGATIPHGLSCTQVPWQTPSSYLRDQELGGESPTPHFLPAAPSRCPRWRHSSLHSAPPFPLAQSE